MPVPGPRRIAALAVIGTVLAMGVADAQKPPAATPAPQAQPAPAPPPGGKPQAGPRATAPMPGQKPPALGQAPTPQPPPVAATPQPPAVAAPALPAPRELPQPVPANEPASVTALRALLPPGARLTYEAVETLDAATGRARMTGVTLVDSDSRTTAAEVVIEQPSRGGLRALQIRELRAENTAGSQVIVIGALELRNLVLRQPAPATRFDVGAFDVEHMTIRNARLAADVQAAITELVLEGWGGGNPTRIAVTGFEIGGPPRNAPFDRIRIGRIAAAGLDIPGLVAAAIALRQPATLAGEPSFEIEDLAATMRDQPVFSIAGIAARSRVDAAGSGTGSMAIRGVQVLPAVGIADWLTRLGYADIQAELTAESSYDAVSGRIELNALRIAGREVGELALSLLMDGVTRDATMRQDYTRARLHGLSITWLDRSILQRVVRDMAQSIGRPEQDVREQWAGMAMGLLGQRGAAGLDSIRDAILSYIRGQAREIELRAQPPQPVPVLSLGGVGSPAQAQQVLGITAAAR